jgi:hypothetical protein
MIPRRRALRTTVWRFVSRWPLDHGVYQVPDGFDKSGADFLAVQLQMLIAMASSKQDSTRSQRIHQDHVPIRDYC